MTTLEQYFEHGIENYVNGDYDQATAVFCNIIEKFPKEKNAYVNLGFCLIQKMMFEDALISWQDALQIDPRDKEVSLNVIRLSMDIGRLEIAEKQLNTHLTLNPKDVDALKERSTLFLLLDDLDTAEKNLKKALGIQEERADLHFELGNLYLRKERYDDSLEQLELAFNLNKNDHRYALALGKLNFKLESYNEAREYFETTMELMNEDKTAQAYLDIITKRCELCDEAVSISASDIRYDPPFVEIILNITNSAKNIISGAKVNLISAPENLKIGSPIHNLDPIGADSSVETIFRLKLKGFSKLNEVLCLVSYPDLNTGDMITSSSRSMCIELSNLEFKEHNITTWDTIDQLEASCEEHFKGIVCPPDLLIENLNGIMRSMCSFSFKPVVKQFERSKTISQRFILSDIENAKYGIVIDVSGVEMTSELGLIVKAQDDRSLMSFYMKFLEKVKERVLMDTERVNVILGDYILGEKKEYHEDIYYKSQTEVKRSDVVKGDKTTKHEDIVYKSSQSGGDRA